MKTVLRLAMFFLCLLAMAVPALADEQEDDLERDARYAEGAPPMIPHRIDVNATGEACLACHKEGLHGAPMTPHPERLDCVQCHAQGEIKEKKHDKKGTKHKKSEKGEK